MIIFNQTDAMTLPELAEYSEEYPALFYLGDDGAAGADAEFVVEGRRLPVHSSVLGAASQVLGELFASRQNGVSRRGVAAAPAGVPNGHILDPATHLEVAMSDSLVLAREELSLEGFTLKRVAHFLRFTYWPAELEALDLQLPGAAKTLSACARLAHQLAMPALLDRLDARMEEAVGAHQATLQRLMDWAAVAEECGLRRLWIKCVREIACTLARTREGGCTVRTVSSRDLLARFHSSPQLCKVPSAATLAPGADAAKLAAHDVELLKGMSIKGQLAVMAALLAALHKTSSEDPAALVPPEASLAAALPGIWKLRSAPDSPAGELA